VIRKVVLLTWEKYYNYEKIWGVLVMSTTWENRPPPITIDGEEEYIVEGIMDLRKTKGGEWGYLVKWKGYGLEESIWEPGETLKNAQKPLLEYRKSLKKKALDATKALQGGAVL
jgi:hypothetical protein